MTLNDLLKLSEHASKYCVGMEGNISGKIDTDSFLIKASGSMLSKLTVNDLINYNFNGEKISKTDKEGSMELGFHSYLLSFGNINFISHTHPINTLKILCGNSSDIYDFQTKRLFPDQVIFNGTKSCIVPYTKPGNNLTVIIKECVSSFIKNEGYFPKLILLENHGIIACGKTVDECIIITEICEKSAEIFNGINTKKRFLTPNQVLDLTNDEKEKYRKSLL